MDFQENERIHIHIPKDKKNEAISLFIAAIKKEAFFILVLTATNYENNDNSDARTTFLDLCRLEDKIYFHYKVELEDVMNSKLLQDLD